jgi:hypothetical protein
VTAGALAVLAILGVAGIALVLDREAAAVTFYDDAFYYFQIARHVAQGAGVTFDGVHATNGFHPLWLAVLVPVFRLVPGDVAPLRVVLAIEALLVAGAMVNVFRVLRPRLGHAAAAAGAMLLLAQPAAARVLRGGMESALVLCLLAVVWSRWLALRDDPAAPPARWLRLGVWCALLFLARLEAALALVVLVVLARKALGNDRRRLAALLAPTAVCALAYLAWTQLVFDTWGPVSAQVKAEFGARGWAAQSWAQRSAMILYVPWIGDWAVRGVLARLGLSPVLAPALASALLLAILVATFRYRHAVVRAIARSGAAFVLASSAAMLLADKAGMMLMLDWYRAPVLLATAVAGAMLVAAAPVAARIAAAVLAAVCLVQAPHALWHLRHPPASPPAGLLVADWLRARAGAGRAASWNGGLIGYFAGGGVVNLDGLVNDARFVREVVQGKALGAYLRRERIRWLADATTSDGRLAPLLRRYPPSVVREVEGRYRLVAAFPGACPIDEHCRMAGVWESEAAGAADRASR